MKQVHSYQEIGTQLDQGKRAIFTCHPEARVTCVQKHRESDTVTVIISVYVRNICVSIAEYEYGSMAIVLAAFDLTDQDEVWELLV